MSRDLQSRNNASGFTLIEIMVVVVILGILAAMIVPKIMSRPDEARMVKAKQDLLTIQSALDLYKLDNGVYPTTEQGLQALVITPTAPPFPSDWKTGGYVRNLPIDPWHMPYQYVNRDEEIQIYSYGPKGPSGNHAIQLP
ncbi:MAG: type II secretion system protein GspG [Gammaproteobacteria bacterium RIFCSPHIGHO2_12_FULL_42_10]|nr:MAG: type II secretion system protein GspG [Gammaproteobacteria bacterium RIFCSPHIGHO2_12_FULL_42_10]